MSYNVETLGSVPNNKGEKGAGGGEKEKTRGGGDQGSKTLMCLDSVQRPLVGRAVYSRGTMLAGIPSSRAHASAFSHRELSLHFRMAQS